MLRIESLSKIYGDGTVALTGIGLAMGGSEILALVGGSGCGKTTLLRLVAGLDSPDTGSIRLDDEPVVGPHPGIGIVFQEPRLLPWLSIADNVGFGLGHLPRPERRERVAHGLDKVGLTQHAGRWPREISGGQQQRAAIARAFVTEPRLLLLDEPFSALDAFTRASLHEELLGLWEERRPMVLLVTHDVAEAVTLADRILVMRPRPGRIEDEVAIHLRRPRQPASAAFERKTRQVLGSLNRSLKPTDRPAEGGTQGSALWW